MKKVLSVLLQFCLISAIFSFSGCHSFSNSELQKKYGDDAFYFEGLKKIREKNFAAAKDDLYKSARNGTYFCSKNSYENLLKIVDVQEGLSLSEEMYSKFNDEESAKIYIKSLYNSKEWTKILVLADDFDISNCDDEISYYILKTLFENQFSTFKEKLVCWWTERPVSSFHVKFQKENQNLFEENLFAAISEESFEGINDRMDSELSSIAQFFPEDDERVKFSHLVQFRLAVYNRNYKKALVLFSDNWEEFPKTAQIYSDAGKTCVYGSNKYLKNAEFFKKECDSISENDEKRNQKLFYTHFYAARLYEKATYITAAEKNYIAAMDAAPLSENYDNALWYLLYMSMQKSSTKAVAYVKKWCASWHDPDYFDDTLSLLSTLLLSERKFNEFIRTYEAVYPYASKELASQFAYVSGRLIESKLVSESENNSEETKIIAFKRALDSGSEIYYKVMAAKRLEMSDGDFKSMLYNEKKSVAYDSENNHEKNSDELKISDDAGVILEGYADYGLADLIYPEWKKLQGKKINISLKKSRLLSDFLYRCGKENNEYYPQSLRIISKAAALFPNEISEQDYKLMYPRDYQNLIEKHCREFNVPEEIMFALVRSESFFDSEINSSAGACGLSQLMKSTAGDIAKKLKVSEYDLKDSDTNLRFGTYYLSNLYSRLENNWLHAFFAYNGGKKRISQWLSDANYQGADKKRYADDLFLEMVPITETRGYGRKLVGAASIYGFLYYEKSISKTINELCRQ